MHIVQQRTNVMRKDFTNGQHGMVGVEERVGHDGPGLVPCEVFVVDQYAH